MPLMMSAFMAGVSLSPVMSVSIETGGDAIDTDAVRSEFTRHGLGKAQNAGLCRRIMGSAKDAPAALGRDG